MTQGREGLGRKLRSRLALAGVILLGSLWPAAVAGAIGHGPGLGLSVQPPVGTARTHFVLSFTAQLTGFTFPDASAYHLVVAGGSRHTCKSAQQVPVPATTPGERVHLTLAPNTPFGLWCKGAYTGRLEEVFRPICAAGTMCPLIARPMPSVIIVRTLARFHFRVR